MLIKCLIPAAFMACVLCGCVIRDKDNVYVPLIPPRSFIDTCANEHFVSLDTWNFGRYAYAVDSDMIVATDNKVVRIRANGDTVWAYTQPGRQFGCFAKNNEDALFLCASSAGDGTADIVKLSVDGSEVFTVPNQEKNLYPVAGGGMVLLKEKQYMYVYSATGTLADTIATFSDMREISAFCQGGNDRFYVAGTFDTLSQKYYRIMCFDLNGAPVWKTAVNRADEHAQTLLWFDQRLDFIVEERSTNEFKLYHFDPEGVLAEKVAMGMEQHTDGTFIQVEQGFFFAGSAWDKANKTDAFLARLAPDGTLVWQKRFGNSGTQESFYTAVLLPDGSIVAAGSTYGFTGKSRLPEDQPLTIKMDENGQTCY